jgi:predicted GNAT family acetyltransferase
MSESETTPQFEIVHNEEARQFEVTIDKRTAKVTYVMLSPTSIIYTHTVVPFSLKGQGIASTLARYVLDYARENNLNVIPQCPFIRSYIDSHPEYEDLVMKSTR